MADRLAELFANKPTSSTGVGLVYNGDSRGNGVLSDEQGVVVIQRFNQSEARGESSGLEVYLSDTTVRVRPGTVLYLMPTIGGTALDAGSPPTLSVPSSGTRYVVVTVSGTLDVVDSIFVRPTMTSVTVTIAISATQPVYADMISSSGTFKFSLATFVDGVKTAQNGHGPITGELCDNLAGTATAILNLTYAL